MPRLVRIQAFVVRALFNNDVRVCTADAERIDTGTPRTIVVLPLGEFCIDKEGAVLEVDFRIWPLEVKAWWYLLCSSESTVLINPATPAATSRCPTFVFREPMAQKPFLPSGTKSFCQRRNFNRVAKHRAGSVRFYIRDCFRVHCGLHLGHPDDLRLSFDTRHGVADFHRTVVVDGQPLITA